MQAAAPVFTSLDDVSNLSLLLLAVLAFELLVRILISILQVAEERVIAGWCGNPLCRTPVSWQVRPKARFRALPDGIAPAQDRLYCGPACRKDVEFFAAQLGDPADRLQPHVLEMILGRLRQHTGEKGAWFHVIRVFLVRKF